MAEGTSRTGLTENEAKEVHGLDVQAATALTITAVAAHVLVWMWRPIVYAGTVVSPDWRFF